MLCFSHAKVLSPKVFFCTTRKTNFFYMFKKSLVFSVVKNKILKCDKTLHKKIIFFLQFTSCYNVFTMKYKFKSLYTPTLSVGKINIFCHIDKKKQNVCKVFSRREKELAHAIFFFKFALKRFSE